MYLPSGDQGERLSLPGVVVSCLIGRKIVQFRGQRFDRTVGKIQDAQAVLAGVPNSVDDLLPSGDQVGNPLFGRPLVSSLGCCEPSARTIINLNLAGSVSRAPKKPPNPKAIHCPSGDQVGTKAAPLLSEKTTFLSEPSAFIKRPLYIYFAGYGFSFFFVSGCQAHNRWLPGARRAPTMLKPPRRRLRARRMNHAKAAPEAPRITTRIKAEYNRGDPIRKTAGTVLRIAHEAPEGGSENLKPPTFRTPARKIRIDSAGGRATAQSLR